MSKFSWKHKRSLPKALVEQVAAEVAREAGLRVRDIMGSSAARHPAHARHLAMWRLRQILSENGEPRYSFPEIGRAFGRDHTSAMHACRRVDGMLSTVTPSLSTTEHPQIMGEYSHEK